MKTALPRKTLLATLFVLPLITTVASAETNLPKRKAGLWEVSVTQEGSPAPAHTMKQCIDEQTDAKMQQSGTEMVEKMGGKCTKNELQKTARGYEGSADCNISGSHMVSSSLFAGDFQSQYTGEITTTYDPPMMGNAKSKTKLSAKYLGACAADQVPGDMILSNGMKVNANQIMANTPPAMGSDPKGPGGAADLEKMKAEVMKRMLERQAAQQQAPGSAPAAPAPH